MNLLHNRPLASSLLLFLIGSLLLVLLPTAASVIAAAFCLLAMVTISILHFFGKKIPMLIFMMFSSLLTASVLSHCTFFVKPILLENCLPESAEDSRYTFAGTVNEILYDSDESVTFVMNLESVNDNEIHIFPSCKLEVTGIKYVSGEDFRPSDSVRITSEVSFLSLPLGESDFGTAANGCVATLDGYITGHTTRKEGLSYSIFVLRTFLSDRLADGIGGEDAELLKGLLLGTDNMAPSTYLAFRRCGVSHILAISGLHLAVMSYLLLTFLEKLRFGKKLRNSLFLVFLLFYVAITGFTPSVVRSALMTAIAFSGFFFGKPYDSFTGVLFAGSLMVFFSPSTICDIGFLLSVTATFGVIVASELKRKSERQKRLAAESPFPPPTPFWKRCLYFIADSFLLSAFAMVATFPIVAIVFGEISWMSPIMNLLLSPLLYILIGFGLLSLLFPVVPFTFVADIAAKVLLFLVKQASTLPDAMLSMSKTVVQIAVCFGAFGFFLLLCLPIKHKKAVFAPLIIATVIVAGAAVTDAVCKNTEMFVSYSSNKYGEAFAVGYGRDLYIADMGASTTRISKLAEKLKENGYTRASGIFLKSSTETDYTALRLLLGKIRIENLYIRTPGKEEDSTYYRKILALAEDALVEVTSTDEYLSVESQKLSSFFAVLPTDEKPVAALAITSGDTSLFYFSIDWQDFGSRTFVAESLLDADSIIVGIHGCNTTTEVPYRQISDNVQYVIIGDRSITSWPGVQVTSALQKARVIDSPVLCTYTMSPSD